MTRKLNAAPAWSPELSPELRDALAAAERAQLANANSSASSWAYLSNGNVQNGDGLEWKNHQHHLRLRFSLPGDSRDCKWLDGVQDKLVFVE
jgi:hypothetical protein